MASSSSAAGEPQYGRESIDDKQLRLGKSGSRIQEGRMSIVPASRGNSIDAFGNPQPSLSIASDRRLAFTQQETDREVLSVRLRRWCMAAPARCRLCSGWAVDNKYMVALTAVITAFALVGDDIRLLFTSSESDSIFDALTLTSMFIFFVEMVLTSVGKSGYFLGFFFYLDFLSTVTLVLGLSYLASDSLDIRAARTARIGARAGRVVRVIRFVRILKSLQVERKKRRESVGMMETGDEDEWLDDVEQDKQQETKEQSKKESRVGKKLSELTTKRVIILVLVMLLVVPLMQTNPEYYAQAAPFYAVDSIQEALVQADALNSTESRKWYENAMLKAIYYNNWFTRSDGCQNGNVYSCPASWYSALFWFGIEGKSRESVDKWAAIAQLSTAEVARFQDLAKTQDNSYNFGTFPRQIEDLLSAEWSKEPEECEGDGWLRRGISLLSRPMPDYYSRSILCPQMLRPTERARYTPLLVTSAQFADWHVALYYDVTLHQQMEALFGILVTVTTCIVLTIAALTFSADANTLVLGPVEQMINRLQIIQRDPFKAVKMSDEEFREEERIKAQVKKSQARGSVAFVPGLYTANKLLMRLKLKLSGTMKVEPMETVVIEKTIIKLGALLTLGFGEAGANIIRQNMEEVDSANVQVTLIGKVVDAIIVSARIHDFSTATEVLQRKIMTFVNQIAEIVHGVVNEWFGAPNKNNGDHFLLIWRCDQVQAGQKATIEPTKLADMAMYASCSILAAIHTSPVLAMYRTHPALQMCLGSNLRVCMTFGVHAGWAIEGAVGSDFKIDATYISPHVNIAIKMEQIACLYGVPIIVSDAAASLASPNVVNEYCRLIGKVSLRGSKVPLCIHSLDMHYECLQVAEPAAAIKWSNRRRFNARQFIEAEKTQKRDEDFQLYSAFQRNQDIRDMRRAYTTAFLQTFHMGYQNYSSGEWHAARNFLVKLDGLTPFKDGPATAIMQFMEDHKFMAPIGWIGVRDLDSSLSMD